MASREELDRNILVGAELALIGACQHILDKVEDHILFHMVNRDDRIDRFRQIKHFMPPIYIQA